MTRQEESSMDAIHIAELSPDEVATYFSERAPNLKEFETNRARGQCPVCNNDSFVAHLVSGAWSCSPCKKIARNIWDLEMALTGADPETATAEVLRIVGRRNGHHSVVDRPADGEAASRMPSSGLQEGDTDTGSSEPDREHAANNGALPAFAEGSREPDQARAAVEASDAIVGVTSHRNGYKPSCPVAPKGEPDLEEAIPETSEETDSGSVELPLKDANNAASPETGLGDRNAAEGAIPDLAEVRPRSEPMGHEESVSGLGARQEPGGQAMSSNGATGSEEVDASDPTGGESSGDDSVTSAGEKENRYNASAEQAGVEELHQEPSADAIRGYIQEHDLEQVYDNLFQGTCHCGAANCTFTLRAPDGAWKSRCGRGGRFCDLPSAKGPSQSPSPDAIAAYARACGLAPAGEDFEGECPFCAANPHFLMGGSGDWECRSCGRSGEFADLPSPEPAKPTSGGTGPSSTSPPGLIKDKRGAVRPVLANAITALRQAWKDELAFNEFSHAVVHLKSGAEWSDEDDIRMAEWLQRKGILVSREIAGQAVQVVARDVLIHPVRDYLRSLTWDGTPRLDQWLPTYLGASATPYVSAVGSRWLIAAVARIFKPGCKADNALIVEGPQGILKSSVFQVLAGKWFTDDIAELGSKDAALQTRGVWIIELSELDAMSRAEADKVKSFMSRSTDRFRPPYGRRPIESPRQCVFAGTVNHATYLRDETGNRRFWPVTCGRIDIDALRRDRDQLWAEAVDRYHAGDPWWLETPELNALAAEEQSERLQQDDPWSEKVIEWAGDWCEVAGDVSVYGVLETGLDLSVQQRDQRAANRVARILKAAGFERFRKRDGEKLEWRYRRRPGGTA
jgi:predicted P-loop ATPase/ribosomal protein L37AE/L43A